MARMRVVFPLPEGPSSPVILPAGMVKSRPLKDGNFSSR